jgi:hypothetical protein
VSAKDSERSVTGPIGPLEREDRRSPRSSGACTPGASSKVAAKLGCVSFTIDRKLRAVREIWAEERAACTRPSAPTAPRKNPRRSSGAATGSRPAKLPTGLFSAL